MATYGYTRVSGADQVKGTSLDEQERKIRGMALMRGAADIRIFRDEGISGSVALDQRPEGAKLTEALRPGDTVIAAKLDRMFRSASDALNRAQGWKEQGVALILADIGTEPVTENGVGKLMFTLLAAMAEWERDRIAERVTEGRAAKKARGGFIGGTPFGYVKIGLGKASMLEQRPDAPAMFATVAEARASGLSYRDIADIVKLKHGYSVSYEAIRHHVRSSQP